MATVIRKVRTPEGVLRYGQPIGTVITKDMQIKAGLRFLATPFTVQYGLGVLDFHQLQKVAAKQSGADVIFPDGWDQIVPKAAKDAHLESLWGLVISPEKVVYRWDRRPDGAILPHTVTASELPDSLKAQLPDGVTFSTESRLGPEGTKIPDSLLWLDSTKLPPVPKSSLVNVGAQELVAEGDDAPGLKPKGEPSARWQKVDSKATVNALQAKVTKDQAGIVEGVPQRLFFDGQSVGIIVKTENDSGTQWRLYRNGKLVTTGSTKSGVLSTATDKWMDGSLTPDGKATLASAVADAADLGADTGIVPTPGVEQDLADLEEVITGPDIEAPDEALEALKQKLETPGGAEVPFDELDPDIQKALSDALGSLTAEQWDDQDSVIQFLDDAYLSIGQVDAALDWLSSYGMEGIKAPKVKKRGVEPGSMADVFGGEQAPTAGYLIKGMKVPAGAWLVSGNKGTEPYGFVVWDSGKPQIQFWDGGPFPIYDSDDVYYVKVEEYFGGNAKWVSGEVPGKPDMEAKTADSSEDLETPVFESAYHQIYSGDLIDPGGFETLPYTVMALLVRHQANNVTPTSEATAVTQLEDISKDAQDRFGVGFPDQAGMPAGWLNQLRQARAWLATHPESEIPQTPEDFWAQMPKDQRDFLIEAMLVNGQTEDLTPWAQITFDDWKKAGFSIADIKAVVPGTKAEKAKPAGFDVDQHGTLTLFSGDKAAMSFSKGSTAVLVFSPKYNGPTFGVSKIAKDTELTGLSGFVTVDAEGTPTQMWYWSGTTWQKSSGVPGSWDALGMWSTDPDAQTMKVSDLAEQDPAFQLDLDALKTPLADKGKTPKVSMASLASPGTKTFSLDLGGGPTQVDIPDDAVLLYDTELSAKGTEYEKHLKAWIRIIPGSKEDEGTLKIHYQGLSPAPGVAPMSFDTAFDTWDVDFEPYAYVPLSSFEDMYISDEGPDGLSYKMLSDAISHQLGTKAWKQETDKAPWWDSQTGGSYQFPSSVQAGFGPGAVLLSESPGMQSGQEVKGFALLPNGTAIKFAVGPDGAVLSQGTADMSYVSFQVKDALIGQDVEYHLSDSTEFNAMKAWASSSFAYKMHVDHDDPLSEYGVGTTIPFAIGGVEIPLLDADGNFQDLPIDELQATNGSLDGTTRIVKFDGTYYVVGGQHTVANKQASGSPVFHTQLVFDADAVKDQILGTSTPDTPTAVHHLPGGVDATPEQVQQALDVLTSAKGMMIKQPLAKAGNPLAGTDYHAMAAPYLEKHKDQKFKTKLAYLDALNALIGQTPKDVASPGPTTDTDINLDFSGSFADVPKVLSVYDSKGHKFPGLGMISHNTVLVYDVNAPSFHDQSIPVWQRGLAGWATPTSNGEFLTGIEIVDGVGPMITDKAGVDLMVPSDGLRFLSASVIIDHQGQFQVGELSSYWDFDVPGKATSPKIVPDSGTKKPTGSQPSLISVGGGLAVTYSGGKSQVSVPTGATLMYTPDGQLRGWVIVDAKAGNTSGKTTQTITSWTEVFDVSWSEHPGAPPIEWLDGHGVPASVAAEKVTKDGSFDPSQYWGAPLEVMAAGSPGVPTPSPSEPSPLHPFAPPAAGRWGKKGSKAYLDVGPDGSGVWTAASGNPTVQTPVQVRARIAKGLSLQVAADPWPHHGMVGKTYSVQPNPLTGGDKYRVYGDGSVGVLTSTGGTAGPGLTAEEFSELIKSLAEKGQYLYPAPVDTWMSNGPNNLYAHMPLFADRDGLREFAKEHGPVFVLGVSMDSDGVDEFLDALDSDSSWQAWAYKHSEAKLAPNPVLAGSTGIHYSYKFPSLSWSRNQVLTALGEVPATHTPTQQGRYQETGPFWVNTGTNGVFAPVGMVRDAVQGRLREDWLKTGELSTAISTVVSDLGLDGVLFAHKSKFNKADKVVWLRAFQAGRFDTLKEMEIKRGNDSPLLAALPDHVAWEAAVPSEISALHKVPGSWSSADVYDLGTVSDAEVDNYLIAAKMAFPEYLSVTERRQWASRHQAGMKVAADALSVQARNRALTGEAPVSKVPVFTAGLSPTSTYAAPVADGSFFLPGSLSGMSWAAKTSVWQSFYTNELSGKTVKQVKAEHSGKAAFIDALADSFAVNGKFTVQTAPTTAAWEKAQAVQQQWEEAQAKIPVLSVPASKNPKLKKDHSTHPVSFVKDQLGNDWIFKQMPEKFRVDIEAMATQVADLYGYGFPEVIAVTDPDKHHLGAGKIGFAQRYAPNKGSMQQLGLTATDLTQTQLVDLALDHVLDWLIDNDDSHDGNYLIGDDGHLIPIDKARTMKHYGVWKGLSGDYTADSNEALISTQMFQGIASHQISEADAQAAYKAALKKAREIQDSDWEPLEALITAAMADRTQWYPASTPQNTKQLLAKVKARKAQMAADIESVWAKAFKKAGYSVPAVAAPPKNDRYHSVDAQFDVNLEETKILGQSVMVTGPAWEDGHIHFWQEYFGGTAGTDWKDSKPVVRGQAHLLGPKKVKLYNDLYDAAELSTTTGKLPDSNGAVKAEINVWRDDTDLAFIELAKKHSNKILGKDGGAAVTPAEIDALVTQKQAAWDALKKQIASTHATGVNPASTAPGKIQPEALDVMDARVTAWLDQMATELKAAVAEDRKVKREPLYKPEFPVGVVIGSQGFAGLWNTWYDKYGKSYNLTPGDVGYDPDPPDPVALFSIPDKATAPKQVASVFEQRFPELAAMGVTLKVRKIKATSGLLSQSKLELHSINGSGQSDGWEGYEYVLRLPTGEEVMVAGPSKTIASSGIGNGPAWAKVPHGQPTLASRAGMVRFEGNPDQSASQVWAAVRPVLDVLEPTGDPTDAHLEVLYYRMMTGMFQNRKDPSAKHTALIKAGRLKAQELGLAVHEKFDPSILGQVMTEQEQITFWREQFSKLVGKTTFDGFLKADGWRPRFDHDIVRSGLPVGHPYWYRVDADPVKLVEGDRWMIQDGMTARPMVYTGILSTDERVRVLGQYHEGASSGTDQKNGAGTPVYMRSKPLSDAAHSVVLSPMAGMRIGTYGFNSDYYGKPWYRESESYLDVQQMMTNSGFEVMAKWRMGLESAYAVRCSSATERQRIIAELKALGITQINGVPVEDMFVDSGYEMQDAAMKSRKAEIAAIKKQIAEKGWI